MNQRSVPHVSEAGQVGELAVSSTGDFGVQVFRIHEGTKVRIEQVSYHWVETEILEGKVGWILAECIEEKRRSASGFPAAEPGSARRSSPVTSTGS